MKTQDISKGSDTDWKYIQANIRCQAWRGYKAGAYARQDLRDIEQSLWAMVERYLADFTPRAATESSAFDVQNVHRHDCLAGTRQDS